jgi:hypothetical protein
MVRQLSLVAVVALVLVAGHGAAAVRDGQVDETFTVPPFTPPPIGSITFPPKPTRPPHPILPTLPPAIGSITFPPKPTLPTLPPTPPNGLVTPRPSPLRLKATGHPYYK